MAGKRDTLRRKRTKTMPTGIRRRVVKLRDGSREVRWFGRVKRDNGKWSEVRLSGCADQDEAYDKLKAIRRGEQLTVSETHTLTVDNLIKIANNHSRKRLHMSKDNIQRINNHIRPYYGNRSLENIDLSTFKTHLENKAKDGRHLKPQTVKHIILTLGKLLQAGNVTYETVEFSFNNKKTYTIEDHHLSSMIEIADKRGGDLPAMLAFFLDTGCRRSELVNVKWSNIDWKQGNITFLRTKNGKDHTIYMNEALIKLLKERRLKSFGQVYIFPGKNGGPRCKSALTRLFKRLKDSAGLPVDAQPIHCLRSVFASRKAAAGVPVLVIKELLNHSDVQTTQRYIRIDDSAKREAMKKGIINGELFNR